MKHLLFVAAATAMFTTSAAAGGFAFTLPTLDYPPSETVTVGKDCLPQTTQQADCLKAR